MKKETRGISNLFTDGDVDRNFVLDHITEAICQFSLDGRLNYVNRAFCNLFQKSSLELTGASYFDLVSRERSANIHDTCNKLIPGQQLSYLEFFGEAPGGGAIWRHWVDTGIFDHNAELTEILASGRLIDDRELLGFVTERYDRGVGALTTATTALLTTLELEALLGKILDAAIGAIPNAERGMLHLIASDTGQLQMRAVLGFEETDSRIHNSIPAESGYLAQAVRTRSAIRLDENAAHAPGQSSQRRPSQHQSAIAAPLLYQNHILGTLSLEATGRAAFTQNDLGLLTNFANTVTAAIRNAQLHAEVQRLAKSDELTGLLNRRGFFELGEREIERAARYKRPLVLMLIDIDHLKQHNDSFGHDIGDKILRHFGNIVRSNTRKVDIWGRYGGDEIAILLPETDLFTAAGVAQRLCDFCNEHPVHVDNKPLGFTISIGVAKLTPEVSNLENLIKRADSALYAAKENGRNRVEIR